MAIVEYVINIYKQDDFRRPFAAFSVTVGGMVSKATHTACYETQNLIGFINYYRLLALVFADGINN